MFNEYFYFMDCLEKNEEVVELGLHENEEFIIDVIDEYHHNLNFLRFDVAKDEAIETVLGIWKEKERD